MRADHASAKQAISLARDLVAFTAIDLFDSDEQIAPFTTLPCAVTLAWSARDKVFPPNLNGLVARQRLPGATYLELANCGHLPMLDNWRVCASVIRESIARSTG